MNCVDSLDKLRTFNQAGDADFRRADNIDVDSRAGKCAKHFRRDAGTADHTRADD